MNNSVSMITQSHDDIHDNDINDNDIDEVSGDELSDDYFVKMSQNLMNQLVIIQYITNTTKCTFIK